MERHSTRLTISRPKVRHMVRHMVSHMVSHIISHIIMMCLTSHRPKVRHITRRILLRLPANPPTVNMHSIQCGGTRRGLDNASHCLLPNMYLIICLYICA